jgi:hypothetical protein
MKAPGLNDIRHFLFVQVPSGNTNSWGHGLKRLALFLISMMTASFFFEFSRVTNIGCRHLIMEPISGICAFSTRDTPHGMPMATNANASKKDECGAKKVF